MLQESNDDQKEIVCCLVGDEQPGFLVALGGLRGSSTSRVWVDSPVTPRCRFDTFSDRMSLIKTRKASVEVNWAELSI
jgi:hypothetical protein